MVPDHTTGPHSASFSPFPFVPDSENECARQRSQLDFPRVNPIVSIN